MRFEEYARHYDAHAKIQAAVAKRSAEWLDEETNQSTGLELGAGTGLFTRHLVGRGFAELYATDLSPAMIAQGRTNAPKADWSLVDAWNPVWERPVDRLYSCSLLQWAKAPVPVLKAWRDLLKPDGRLLTTFFIAGTLREIFPAGSSLCALEWRRKAQWLEFFRSAGFRIQRSATWKQAQVFPSAIEALRSVHLTGAVQKNKASISELRRTLLAFESAHSGAEGDVRLTWEVMQIEASVAAQELAPRGVDRFSPPLAAQTP